MKKAFLFLIFVLAYLSLTAQTDKKPVVLKYVTTAPDGSVAMTVIDDSRSDRIVLEAASNFYKYQLLDVITSEPVFTAVNKGKKCTIIKSRIATGTYQLKLFTRSFIISSELTVAAPTNLMAQGNQVVAAND